MIIVIDDREKRPWSFPGVETEEARLETGDYSVKGFEDRFAIERKSLNDLATSVGSERDRFEAEIHRAQSFDNFAVIIEATPDQVRRREYYSGIHPNAVLGTCRKWPWKFDKLEFVWSGDADRAAQEALYYLDRWYLNAASGLF